MTTHDYRVRVTWTGNTGDGTLTRRGYRRDTVTAAGEKPALLGSSDPAYLGDAARWNPEELLLVSLSQCHLLWYLDIAARAGVVVTDYVDDPVATMVEESNGAGQFTRATLRPTVTITDENSRAAAMSAHSEAHAMCFIARSVNFPVDCEPVIRVAGEET
jgi:organic hydroperoxide reductase OsmC/OhrA